MTRSAALARLQPLEAALRRAGVTALFLFGSVARDEAVAGSDVDLLFDVDAEARFSLFDQGRVQTELADLLDVDVDLIPVAGLRAGMRSRIDRDLVRVF